MFHSLGMAIGAPGSLSALPNLSNSSPLFANDFSKISIKTSLPSPISLYAFLRMSMVAFEKQISSQGLSEENRLQPNS